MKNLLEIIFKKINRIRGLGKAQAVGRHVSPIQRGTLSLLA